MAERGAYSFVACISPLTICHASLSRRSTVPTPNKYTSKIWVLITFFPYITYKPFAYLITFLFRRLWPPYISEDDRDRFFATRYYLVSQTSPCHIHSSIFLISPSNTSRSFLYISHSPTSRMWVLLSTFFQQGHIRPSPSSSSRLLVYLSLLSGRSRPPARNRCFSVFTQSIGPGY